MTKSTLLATLSVSLLLGAGCQTQQTQEQVTSLPSAVEELQTQTVSESEKQEKSETSTTTEPIQVGITLYKGAWFDIEYPQNFTARPTTPTDEAYFTSPDGTVEFFVYSPLWGGNPETYLTIATTEEVVSKKTEEVKENERTGQFGDKIVRWVTVKAKDGSYYRSFVSIKEQVGTGSDLHHVFGIKYQDNKSYEKYREAYVDFKTSLTQYSD